MIESGEVSGVRVISASRRTDIPAFYGEWFRRRLRHGWCTVPNPFNPRQVRRVSLRRDEVAAIVFWTRDPRPFMTVLEELERTGYPSIFLFTLTGYGPPIEPSAPPLATAVAAFRELAGIVGPERVVWRYDPVVLGPGLELASHLPRFEGIARLLAGSTARVKVSFLDLYRKTARRLAGLPDGARYLCDPVAAEGLDELLVGMDRAARSVGMALESCAEPAVASRLGLDQGRCIDPALINRLFGARLGDVKDRGQRMDCGCAPSVDIGRPDSCLHGCVYCYATRSQAAAEANHHRHDPDAPALY